jgi:hypothetical protein
VDYPPPVSFFTLMTELTEGKFQKGAQKIPRSEQACKNNK